MADSKISVTEGSGKNLQTYDVTVASVLVQRQAVILGEQPLASYTISTGANFSTATGDSHILEIMAGASLRVRVRRVEIYQTVAATTAALVPFAIYRVTSAGTGGTSLTPNVLDPSDYAAGCTAMALPSSKGTEGASIWHGAAYFMQTIAASAPMTEPILVVDFDRPRSKPLIINAGTTNGMCIKNLAACAGASVRFTVWIDETAW